MKFALTALTSAAMAGVMVSAQDPTHDLVALQAEYNALAPKLLALIPEGAAIPGKFDLDLNSLGGLMSIKKTPFPYSGVGPTHFEAVRDYGYVELADRMEQSARSGLEAGRIGLQALRKLIASNGEDINALSEANILGAQAFDMSLQSLSELPKPGAIAPGTVENLRAAGYHLVADGLANMQHGMREGTEGVEYLKKIEGTAKVDAYDSQRTPIKQQIWAPAVPAAPVAAAVAPAVPAVPTPTPAAAAWAAAPVQPAAPAWNAQPAAGAAGWRAEPTAPAQPVYNHWNSPAFNGFFNGFGAWNGAGAGNPYYG